MDLSIDLAKMPVTGETIFGEEESLIKLEERGPIRRGAAGKVGRESPDKLGVCWTRMNSDKSW